MSVILVEYFENRVPVLDMLQLEAELAQRLNNDVLTELKQKKTVDSEKTPQYVKDWIVNKLKVKFSQMLDQCRYNSDWTSGRDYDLYAEKWVLPSTGSIRPSQEAK